MVNFSDLKIAAQAQMYDVEHYHEIDEHVYILTEGIVYYNIS